MALISLELVVTHDMNIEALSRRGVSGFHFASQVMRIVDHGSRPLQEPHYLSRPRQDPHHPLPSNCWRSKYICDLGIKSINLKVRSSSARNTTNGNHLIPHATSTS
ncbi:hypothetical protein GE21DRAFT_1203956 [Neurospora crassa]|nr:hypothetical protein B24B19.230 [imported] - Neurospora crassa [Neurospora crassa]KHE86451.1 hypothetical protein GE21DRAFT_1203956 [Neurospora crassa]